MVVRSGRTRNCLRVNSALRNSKKFCLRQSMKVCHCLLVLAIVSLAAFAHREPYATIILNEQSLTADCLTGTAAFDEPRQVDIRIMAIGQARLRSYYPNIRVDTDWGVHKDVPLVLWYSGGRHPYGIVHLNLYRQAEMHRVYAFSICGFHSFFETPAMRLSVTSDDARIFMKG